MSPTGQLMSDWLKTSPGLFRAESYDAVFQLAYQNSPFPKRGISFQDFQECLKRVGYDAREKKAHGEGYEYWALSLPEGI